MGGFHLGKMTLGSLFKKPETVQYPVQQKVAPKGLKGHVEVHPDSCILCGICMKRCPCSAITVSKPDREWKIDAFRCIQCGSCVRECPKNCLEMLPIYATPAGQKGITTFSIPEKKKDEAQN